MNNDDDSISLSDDNNSFDYLKKIKFNNEVNESNELNNEVNESNEFTNEVNESNEFNNEEKEPHGNEEINSEKKIEINNRTTTTNTKRGRNKTSDSINPHTRNAIDNKIKKIRIHAITFGIDLFNDCIRKELKKIYRKKKLILRSISREITGDITIDFNNTFFNSTLEFIYSNPLNEKYSKSGKNSNIIVINELKKINNPSINNLLNMKFRDLFTLFVNSDKNYSQKEFGIKKAETFDDFISDLQKKNEYEKYISDLKKLLQIFLIILN